MKAFRIYFIQLFFLSLFTAGLAAAGDAGQLLNSYKQTANVIEHAAAREKQAILRTGLFSGEADIKADISGQAKNLEALNFVDGKKSVLAISNAVSAEYGPQKIQDVMDFFVALEKAELVKPAQGK